MANTAINHDPAATFPGSSTDTAVVKWSGSGGKTLANSGVTIDASNNLTIPGNVTTTGYVHLTGDEKALRFYEGSNFISIAAPSGLDADYTFTLPLNDGAASEFLQTDGNGVLVWAAVHADAHTVVSHSDTSITGAELTQLSGISANVTDTNLNTLTDGSSTTSLHAHSGGGPSQANEAAIEAETNEDTYIPPDLAKHLNGVLKCYHRMDANAGALVSHNITSTARDSTGTYTVTIATDITTSKCTLVCHNSGSSDTTAGINGTSASSYGIAVYTAGSLSNRDTNGGMLGNF